MPKPKQLEISFGCAMTGLVMFTVLWAALNFVGTTWKAGLLAAGVPALSLLWHWFVHRLRVRMVRRAVESVGGREVSMEWKPLGSAETGTMGLICVVRYVDASGKPVARYCKVGVLEGVFWSDEPVE